MRNNERYILGIIIIIFFLDYILCTCHDFKVEENVLSNYFGYLNVATVGV